MSNLPVKLGKYEIVRVVGKGAMGLVYEGFDPVIERTVAIKTIRTDELDPADAEEHSRRFRIEAKAAGKLNHPNIVAIYDFGEQDALAFIVMEFIHGRELKTFFDTGHRFPLATAMSIMQQLLEALGLAHARGIVHRDIKPANIFITEEGTLKLGDFGIARIDNTAKTHAGTILGTPSYMPPEQMRGDSTDPRSDLYSAGVILYQFLTGEKPFSGSMVSVMHKVMNENPVPPSELNPEITPEMEVVVARAMAKQMDARFPDARSFWLALRSASETRLQEEQDAEATLIIRPGTRPTLPPAPADSTTTSTTSAGGTTTTQLGATTTQLGSTGGTRGQSTANDLRLKAEEARRKAEEELRRAEEELQRAEEDQRRMQAEAEQFVTGLIAQADAALQQARISVTDTEATLASAKPEQDAAARQAALQSAHAALRALADETGPLEARRDLIDVARFSEARSRLDDCQRQHTGLTALLTRLAQQVAARRAGALAALANASTWAEPAMAKARHDWLNDFNGALTASTVLASAAELASVLKQAIMQAQSTCTAAQALAPWMHLLDAGEQQQANVLVQDAGAWLDHLTERSHALRATVAAAQEAEQARLRAEAEATRRQAEAEAEAAAAKEAARKKVEAEAAASEAARKQAEAEAAAAKEAARRQAKAEAEAAAAKEAARKKVEAEAAAAAVAAASEAARKQAEAEAAARKKAEAEAADATIAMRGAARVPAAKSDADADATLVRKPEAADAKANPDTDATLVVAPQPIKAATASTAAAPPASAGTVSAPAAKSGSNTVMIAAGGALVLAIGGWFALKPGKAPEPPSQSAPTETPSPTKPAAPAADIAAEAKVQAETAAKRKAQADEEARKATEEEGRKSTAEDASRQKLADEAARAKTAEETKKALAQAQAGDDARKKQVAADAAKRQAELDLEARKKAEDDAKRKSAEDDAKRKQAADDARKADDTRKKAAADEEARRKAAEDARKADDAKKAEDARKAQVEEDARKKTAEAKPAAPEAANKASPAELFRQAQALESSSMKDAVRKYEEAGNAGFGPASKRLGEIYVNGAGNVRSDYVKSVKWFSKAKEQGQ